jgi:hypothetical protein
MSLNNRIRVVLAKPGIPPSIGMVENDFSLMQRFVGGFIEAVRLSTYVFIYCNENGRAAKLRPRAFKGHRGIYEVHGNFIVLAMAGAERLSLSSDQALFWLRRIEDDMEITTQRPAGPGYKIINVDDLC